MKIPSLKRLSSAAGVVLALATPSFAQSSGQVDLLQLSLEDLLNIEVTAASRRQQRAIDVAAAMDVITQDDIRRSGRTTLPEVLRLAAGVSVSQLNSNKPAVTVRGFNSATLVLINGRTIYNRLFATVIWDAEDLMIDDIERIEVIRGPAAALWGANAVNGVINIVTKSSADTRGGLVRVEGGRSGGLGAARYGGTFKDATYRLFAQWTSVGESVVEPGIGADDQLRRFTSGLRADWTRRGSAFLLDGAVSLGDARGRWWNSDPQTAPSQPFSLDPTDWRGGHVLGRWTHTRASGASTQLQSFVDIGSRNEPMVEYNRRVIDVEAQHNLPLRGRHHIVSGAGHRVIGDHFVGKGAFSLEPADHVAQLSTAFVHDEIGFFERRVAVTIGSQFQYDSEVGWGVQPTARAMWKMRQNQRLWAATSRALRTPSRYERGQRVVYPAIPMPDGVALVLAVEGNPDAKTESLVDGEVGYRMEIGNKVSFDVTGFTGRFNNLRTLETQPPQVELTPSPHIVVTTRTANFLDATSRGFEVVGRWTPLTAWTLDGSYSAFHLTPHLAPQSLDVLAATEDGNAPRAQWQLRSVIVPTRQATVNAAVFRVGRLRELGVNAYTRVDVTAEWRFNRQISAMLIGHNLLDRTHPEWAGAAEGVLVTQVPRSIGVRLRWTM